MENITDLFIRLLEEFRSVDIANREFSRMIDDDPDLKAKYAEWCEESGYEDRDGFIEFAEEFIETQNSIWDTLTDYDYEDQ
ncbi:MAG: hypothetical protein K2K82_09245 [Muribaculaceae bacterium]|nr:hypothetical protein [Muribaculaceae bacterium]